MQSKHAYLANRLCMYCHMCRFCLKFCSYINNSDARTRQLIFLHNLLSLQGACMAFCTVITFSNFSSLLINATWWPSCFTGSILPPDVRRKVILEQVTANLPQLLLVGLIPTACMQGCERGNILFNYAC